jgi:hypothetical protein
MPRNVSIETALTRCQGKTNLSALPEEAACVEQRRVLEGQRFRENAARLLKV